MSASSYMFRSHLMQQFVAGARNQGRTTPIALIGWMSNNNNNTVRHYPNNLAPNPDQNSVESNSLDPTLTPRRDISSIGTSAIESDESSAIHKMANTRQASASSPQESTPSSSSSFVSKRDTIPQQPRNVELSRSFQQLIQTRRTSRKFLKLSESNLTADDYKLAIDRAVVAGRSAPNHKRTEPFTFKRLLGPSRNIDRLAEIAKEVYLRQHHGQYDLGEDVEQAAEAKRIKWSQIPAFLVTLVSSSSNHQNDTSSSHIFTENSTSEPWMDHDNDESDANGPLSIDRIGQEDVYEALPYQPPASERELEDYAAACAATQNVLLSLHSEQLATKWATGLVIRTAAFRQLVEARESDRVVALIMIGQPATSNTASSSSSLSLSNHRSGQRRFRRELYGDVLVDI